jgi:putative transposase
LLTLSLEKSKASLLLGFFASCNDFLIQSSAIGQDDVPEKIAIDKSGSNKAAIVSIQVDRGLAIVMRQSRYLNNIVEQDHRAIKRVTRPMLGFKTFRCARIIIAGIEIMHRIRKNQLNDIKDRTSSAANQFYSLAF